VLADLNKPMFFFFCEWSKPMLAEFNRAAPLQFALKPRVILA
jgi:hypothetical protein